MPTTRKYKSQAQCIVPLAHFASKTHSEQFSYTWLCKYLLLNTILQLWHYTCRLASCIPLFGLGLPYPEVMRFSVSRPCLHSPQDTYKGSVPVTWASFVHNGLLRFTWNFKNLMEFLKIHALIMYQIWNFKPLSKPWMANEDTASLLLPLRRMEMCLSFLTWFLE